MAHMMTVTVAQMDMQVEELALAVQTKVNVSEMQKKIFHLSDLIVYQALHHCIVTDLSVFL